jgi:membrane protein involved in colicin uptake
MEAEMWRKNWFDVGVLFESDKGDGKGDGGNGKGDGGNGNGDGNPPENQKPPEAKFTQADVDRILGERLTRAEETTQKKLLEALGVANAEEAKTMLSDAKKLREQQMSDLEKAQTAAKELQAAKEKAETDAASAIEKAQTMLMRAAVLAEASKAEYHIKADALPDVWGMIDRSGIKPKADADGEFAGIGEALKALTKSKTYLVDAGDGHGTPRPGATRKPGEKIKAEPSKGFTL